MLLITRSEFLETTSSNAYTSDLAFLSAAKVVQDTIVKPALPPSMWAKFVAVTAGPELIEFRDEYIKPFFCRALMAFAEQNGGMNVVAGNNRVPNSQTGTAASGQVVGLQVAQTVKIRDQYMTIMYNYYQSVVYLFDGIPHPPVSTMKKLWQQNWSGCNYINGVSGWGWYGRGSFYGPTQTVSEFNGVQLIGIRLKP